MKRFIVLAVAVLVVVLAWTGGWFFFADQVRRNVETLALADPDAGAQVQCGDLRITGFPFRFDVACVEAVLVSGDLLVEMPQVRASMLVYRPNHFIASAEGPAMLADAFSGARNRIDFAALDASLRLADFRRIERLSVVASDLRWTDTLLSEALIASAPEAELHLLDMPENHDSEAGTAGLAGYLSLEGLDAPMLEIADGRLAAEAELTGLPDTLLDLGEPDALRRWQAAGGELRLVSLRGEQAQTWLDAQGQLALNPSGQLDGQISLRSRGIAERIAPLLPETYGNMLIGTPDAEGVHAQTINLRGGVVMSGLLPMGMVPPLF